MSGDDGSLREEDFENLVREFHGEQKIDEVCSNEVIVSSNEVIDKRDLEPSS